MTIYAENIFVCIALPLIVSLFFTERKIRRFTSFFLIGMSMCLLSAYITGFFASVEGIDYQESAAFIAPVTEEVMKLLPLLFLFFVYEESGQNIYLASVALGIGFATFENCVYILGNSSESLTYMLIRGLAAGVMHLVCAVALGLGLILEKRHPKLALSGILGILSLSSTFHAIYNLLVYKGGVAAAIGYALPCLIAITLLPPYRRLRNSI